MRHRWFAERLRAAGLVAAGFVLAAAALSIQPLSPAGASTEGLLLQDHALVGSIWDTRTGLRATEADLVAAAARAKWVLLGEKHDNPEHHRLQARIVDAIGAAGRRPAVVWEMAEPAHAQTLRAATARTVDGLGDALSWEARGWPAWSSYRPIAEAALKHGMTMAPGNASPEATRAVGRGEPLTAAEIERLNWTLEYSEAQLDELTGILADSHCRMLPERMLPGMADVQRLRDAWMSASLREADSGDGAILIAGGQHVREDWGVPWRLGEDVFSLAIIEVVRGEEIAETYSSFDEAKFDFVWFTARVDEEDLCEKFRRQMKG
ncbi:ChaN family lipoprotein [Pelagibius sp.]|uniref:ChaN family lipoprotein n=1 Tax=Pelagibius sp. TaxID=1931238 RepID=UPI002601B9E2|nr:ChaN family lipoprotein [Pelagibius sp.]